MKQNNKPTASEVVPFCSFCSDPRPHPFSGVVQSGFGPVILLLQTPECWTYRHRANNYTKWSCLYVCMRAYVRVCVHVCMCLYCYRTNSVSHIC